MKNWILNKKRKTVNFINLAQDKDKLWAVIKMAMNIQGS
jgi:hypothetical protein